MKRKACKMKTVWGIGKHITSIVINYLATYFFNWNMVDLQYYVNFYYTAQWLGYTHTHTHTHTHILFYILFHFDLSQDIKYSYHRVGHDWSDLAVAVLYSRTLMSIHSIYNSSHLPPPNSQSIPSMIFLFKQQLKYKFINRTHWCFECSRILISTWDAEFHPLYWKSLLVGTIWLKGILKINTWVLKWGKWVPEWFN